MALIAIPTRYNGRLFRSRLEARWAVFFDEMGWKYDYEGEGFILSSGYYLPDFFFNKIGMFAEVKPEKLTDIEFEKCCDLSKSMDSPSGSIDVLLLEGRPSSKSIRTIINGDLGINVLLLSVDEKFYPVFSSDDFISEWTMLDRTNVAIRISNEYRFEHGEGLK